MGRIVIVAYKAKEGQADRLSELVRDHVHVLRAESLVTDRAPIVMKTGGDVLIEVFEWASRESVEAAHSNEAVLRMWGQFAEACDYIPIGDVEEAGNLFSEFTPVDVYAAN